MVATNTAFVENQWRGAKLQMGEAVIEIMDDVDAVRRSMWIRQAA